jgi:hypothetical protein
MPLTKAFDRINSVADRGFLATCLCKGNECSCSYDGQDLIPSLSASNNQGSKMSILQKMAAAGIKLDDIKASASSLPLADLKALNLALAAQVKAQEAKTSKKALRIARLQAALENQADDPLVDSRVRLVRGSLRRLGLGDINDHAKNGIDVFELDKACKAAGWKSTQSINLKIQASAIGLMD